MTTSSTTIHYIVHVLQVVKNIYRYVLHFTDTQCTKVNDLELLPSLINYLRDQQAIALHFCYRGDDITDIVMVTENQMHHLDVTSDVDLMGEGGFAEFLGCKEPLKVQYDCRQMYVI